MDEKLSLTKTWILRNYILNHAFFSENSLSVEVFRHRKIDGRDKANVVCLNKQKQYEVYGFYFRIEEGKVIQETQIRLGKCVVHGPDSEPTKHYLKVIGKKSGFDVREIHTLDKKTKEILNIT